MGDNWIVGVVAEHDLVDTALVAQVRAFGFRARLYDFEQLDDHRDEEPVAFVVREPSRIAEIAELPGLDSPALALVQCVGAPLAEAAGVTVIPANGDAGKHLRVFLESVAGRARKSLPVPMTARELEVLTAYVLGATMRDVSERHFIAESTVRTHYRRVVRRYQESGRQVANKAQLLLQLFADGWIDEERIRGLPDPPNG